MSALGNLASWALLAAGAACLLGACASPGSGRDGSSLVGRIFDARTGAFVDEDELLDQLAATRFVLLGERHDRPEHHRLQARIVQALAARGRVFLQ